MNSKPLLVLLAAMLLVVFLAYNYHQRTLADAARREAEVLRQQTEELRQRVQEQAAEATRHAREQADATRRQAQEQNQALEQRANQLSEQATALHAEASALKAQVSAEHAAAEAAQRRSEIRMYRMEGLAAANGVKTAIAEHYMSLGKLPESNAEAGIAASGQFKGRSLQRLDVDRNGAITLIFDEKAGGEGGGVIRLIPEITNTPQALKWRCVSPSYADIAVDAPQCEYRAGA